MQKNLKYFPSSLAIPKATAEQLSRSLVALSIVALFFSQVSPAFATISSAQIDSNARTASAEQAEQYQQAESTGQTESSTQPTQIQQIESASSANQQTIVNIQEQLSAPYGDFEVTGDTSTVSFDSAAGVLTISGGEHTISMAQDVISTSQRIEVTGAATLMLSGINIQTSTGSALKITNDAAFDVNIVLVANTFNNLVTTGYDSAALQKSGLNDVGTLTISGTGNLTAQASIGGAAIGGSGREAERSASNITINGGNITAIGGTAAAAIGGGSRGYGKYITITGGSIVARPIDNKNAGAGIGGGLYGTGNYITISGGSVNALGGSQVNGASAGIGGATSSGSDNNSITGSNTVVIAEAGYHYGAKSGEALQGFGTISQGLIFKKGTKDEVNPSWTVNMYSSTMNISADVSIPANLSIDSNKILTVANGVTLSVNDGATLSTSDTGQCIIAAGGLLQNNGILAEDANISGEGTITTKTDFYLTDGSKYGDKDFYQVYKINDKVQKYKNLPNPDLDPSIDLQKSSNMALNADKFVSWYYTDDAGNKITIDGAVDVLPNQHTFYETRATSYAVNVAELHNGSITPNMSQAAENEIVSLTVTPAEGYELQTDSVNVKAGATDIPVTKKTDNTYTFTMPAADVTVNATFELSIYTVSVAELQNGTITSDKTQASVNEAVTLTVVPDHGYQLKKDSLSVYSDTTSIPVTKEADDTYTFTMPAAGVIVNAEFEQIPGPGPTPEPIPTPDVNPATDATLLPVTGDTHGVVSLSVLLCTGTALLGMAGILMLRRQR